MKINSITHSKYLGKVYDIYPYIIKEVDEKGESSAIIKRELTGHNV